MPGISSVFVSKLGFALTRFPDRILTPTFRLQNLADLKTIIEWNERHGIRFFRMSSQIFPHMENPLVAEKDRYDLSFAMDVLQEVGDLARKYGHRLTFHPSHFNQLGAVPGKVLDGTFADLRMHADILDAMGCDQVRPGTGF